MYWDKIKNTAAFAAAYGVLGFKGVSIDKYPSLKSYSKQVPTPTNRRTPDCLQALARASVPARQSILLGDCKYLPGSAYQAR